MPIGDIDSGAEICDVTAMSTEIKICGLSTPEAVETAAALGADKAGFIFFPKSPRHVRLEQAAALSGQARQAGLVPVAVTVNADQAELDAIVASMNPGMLQFHGSESPEAVTAAKTRYGLPVMKAIAIREAPDLDAMRPYLGVADRFLFDAKPPAGSELPGGNGISFDWRILAMLDDAVDYMLSGGLNKNNIGEALASSGARSVDVSSGVESAPGVKDPGMMKEFVEAVRKHDKI